MQPRIEKSLAVFIEPVCLDVKQAAAFLSTSPHAVRHLIYSRKLKSFTLGKKLVLPVAELRAFVARQTL